MDNNLNDNSRKDSRSSRKRLKSKNKKLKLFGKRNNQNLEKLLVAIVNKKEFLLRANKSQVVLLRTLLIISFRRNANVRICLWPNKPYSCSQTHRLKWSIRAQGSRHKKRSNKLMSWFNVTLTSRVNQYPSIRRIRNLMWAHKHIRRTT